MNYSTQIFVTLLPLLLGKPAADRIVAGPSGPTLEQKIADILQALAQGIGQLNLDFLGKAVDPERTFNFEHQVEGHLRKAGRQFVQAVYNQVEPAVESLPKHVHFEASLYTRLNRKTPQNVGTLFGQIRLHA